MEKGVLQDSLSDASVRLGQGWVRMSKASHEPSSTGRLEEDREGSQDRLPPGERGDDEAVEAAEMAQLVV